MWWSIATRGDNDLGKLVAIVTIALPADNHRYCLLRAGSRPYFVLAWKTIRPGVAVR
jgi:hypothetical protein